MGELNYNEIKNFAKRLGVNVVGKKKEKAATMVLDAIEADYDEKKEDKEVDFNEYKKENQDMLKFYQDNKDFVDPEEEESDPENLEEEEGAKPEEEEKTSEKTAPKKSEKKDLKSTKEKATKAKTDKEIKKKKDGKKVRGKGIGIFICDGLKDGSFKGKSDKEIAEKAVEKFGGNTNAHCVSWYKNKLKKVGVKIKV